jgi:hypothetical protein
MPITRTSGQGRPKGVPNKLNASLREMILGALSDAGGRDYLVRQAETNPGAFLALLGRILPLQMAGDGSGAVTIQVITGVPRWDDPEEESHGCDATRDAG